MKKLFAGILTLALFMSSLPIISFAENAETESTATVEISQRDLDKYEVLKGIEFLPDDFTMGEETLTRAEALGTLMKATSFNIDEGKTIFRDVLPSDKYYNEIYTAYMNGIVSGAGDDMFLPNDKIQASHLAIMMVNVLGYRAHAQVSSYTTLANDLDLYDGVDIKDGEITKTGYVQMLYNMVHAEVVEVEGTNTNGVVYSRPNGMIYINTMDIYTSEGLITEIGLRSLDGRSTYKDTVYINGERLLVEGEFPDVTLGSNVEYYYKEVDQKGDVFKVAVERKNEILTFDIDDVTELTNNSISINVDGRRDKTYKLKTAYYALKNYAPIAPFDPVEILSWDGKVTIVDNNDDGTFECMLIESSDDYLISNIDANNMIIYDDRGKPALDLE